MELIGPLAYLAAVLGLLAGIHGLFGHLEKQLNPKKKKALAGWVTKLDLNQAVSGWPTHFISLFDRVFGEDHLSWKCFLRSSIASLMAAAILAGIWLAVDTEQVIQSIFRPGKMSGLAIVVLLANLTVDYLSLLETRMLLRWLQPRAALTKVLAFVGVDLCATSLIWLMFFPISFMVLIIPLGLLEGKGWPPMWLVVDAWPGFARNLWSAKGGFTSADGAPVGVWFYSTFFTSVWLWLFVLSAIAVAIGRYLGKWFTWLRRMFTPKARPLNFLGIVTSIIVATICFLTPAIVWMVP